MSNEKSFRELRGAFLDQITSYQKKNLDPVDTRTDPNDGTVPIFASVYTGTDPQPGPAPFPTLYPRI